MNRRRTRRRLLAGLLALAFVAGVLLMLHEPANRTRESLFSRDPFATEVAPTVLRSNFATASEAAPTAPDRRGQLAIVIDDIGWTRAAGERVIALPGRLTLAVLPGTPAGAVLSRQAHAAGHEVILHQPMAAHGDASLGPGALRAEATDDEIARIIAANLDALPHGVGLSNHMGSLLTTRKPAMRAVMSAAALRGVYFLDSRTTADTVAQSTARALAVPTLRRDLFLDDSLDPDRVETALDAALELAETRGHAVVIGHPHEVTLEVLERRMDEIRERVRLVPVSNLLRPIAGGQPVAN